jgi:serine/threonine protein kinase
MWPGQHRFESLPEQTAVAALQAMLLRRCADVAAGLVYLHEHAPHQVCHGDLKCENVLLRSGKGGLCTLSTTAGFVLC